MCGCVWCLDVSVCVVCNILGAVSRIAVYVFVCLRVHAFSCVFLFCDFLCDVVWCVICLFFSACCACA